MEIKRYPSIYLLVQEMRKDLFNIEINNSTDEVSLLSTQISSLNFLSECKKINVNKRKKVN